MTVESNYAIAIATLSDWLKRVAPVFQPMTSKTKTNRHVRVIFPRFDREAAVTAAMLVFWDFDSIIVQNLSDILPLFCTLTWPFHHVSDNQEYPRLRI